MKEMEMFFLVPSRNKEMFSTVSLPAFCIEDVQAMQLKWFCGKGGA